MNFALTSAGIPPVGLEFPPGTTGGALGVAPGYRLGSCYVNDDFAPYGSDFDESTQKMTAAGVTRTYFDGHFAVHGFEKQGLPGACRTFWTLPEAKMDPN